MPEPTREESEQEARNRRDQDRRGGDRRRDRRAGPVIWRTPWAYGAYGVVGVILLYFIFGTGGATKQPEIGSGEVTETSAAPAVDTTALPAAAAPPREALGTGEYEKLLAQGQTAVGQRVITQLYCEPVNSVSMSKDVPVSPSIASVADKTGNVPGAPCKWGSAADAPDLLLLVPADLAPRFAAAPEVQQNFVRRRSVRAEVEWVGRSDAFQLREVGVLKAIR
jgi:hypothetical protein